jgi:hypothetical protein
MLEEGNYSGYCGGSSFGYRVSLERCRVAVCWEAKLHLADDSERDLARHLVAWFDTGKIAGLIT